MSQVFGIDAEDLFAARIGDMGTIARGREGAHAPLETWRSGDGLAFAPGEHSLQTRYPIALRSGEPHPRSGRQTHYERLVHQSLRRRAHTTTRLPVGEAA